MDKTSEWKSVKEEGLPPKPGIYLGKSEFEGMHGRIFAIVNFLIEIKEISEKKKQRSALIRKDSLEELYIMKSWEEIEKIKPYMTWELTPAFKMQCGHILAMRSLTHWKKINNKENMPGLFYDFGENYFDQSH